METRSRIFKPMENRLNGAQDLIYDTLGPVLRPRIRLLRQMNYIRLHLQCKSPARRGICFTRLSGAADTKCQRDEKEILSYFCVLYVFEQFSREKKKILVRAGRGYKSSSIVQQGTLINIRMPTLSQQKQIQSLFSQTYIWWIKCLAFFTV